MKKSNGFFTLKIKDKRTTCDGLNIFFDIAFCASEWMNKTYHKKGVSIDYEYIPYKIIKKLIIEHHG